MNYIDFICLWTGRVINGFVASLALYVIGLRIYRRLTGYKAPNMDNYYSGPPTPCCCEYHPQQVCCFCGRIEGATRNDWKYVQPPEDESNKAI